MFAGTIVTYYILQETCQNTSKPKIFHLFFGIFGETLYLCTRKQRDYPCFMLQKQGWFGSSVGLEQQPSKLRVKGSSPFRITKKGVVYGSFFVCINPILNNPYIHVIRKTAFCRRPVPRPFLPVRCRAMPPSGVLLCRQWR